MWRHNLRITAPNSSVFHETLKLISKNSFVTTLFDFLSSLYDLLFIQGFNYWGMGVEPFLSLSIYWGLPTPLSFTSPRCLAVWPATLLLSHVPVSPLISWNQLYSLLISNATVFRRCHLGSTVRWLSTKGRHCLG